MIFDIHLSIIEKNQRREVCLMKRGSTLFLKLTLVVMVLPVLAVVIAVFSAVLGHLLKQVISIRAENEFTV